jgi:hypothetical protein
VSRHVSSVRRASERQAARVSPPQGRGELGGRKPARQGRLLSVVRLSSISAVLLADLPDMGLRSETAIPPQCACLVPCSTRFVHGVEPDSPTRDFRRLTDVGIAPACDGVPAAPLVGPPEDEVQAPLSGRPPDIGFHARDLAELRGCHGVDGPSTCSRGFVRLHSFALWRLRAPDDILFRSSFRRLVEPNFWTLA